MTESAEKRHTLQEMERYTLREMQLLLCRRDGHVWDFTPRRLCDEAPTGIRCDRCGWSGTVTMDDKP